MRTKMPNMRWIKLNANMRKNIPYALCIEIRALVVTGSCLRSLWRHGCASFGALSERETSSSEQDQKRHARTVFNPSWTNQVCRWKIGKGIFRRSLQRYSQFTLSQGCLWSLFRDQSLKVSFWSLFFWLHVKYFSDENEMIEICLVNDNMIW